MGLTGGKLRRSPLASLLSAGVVLASVLSGCSGAESRLETVRLRVLLADDWASARAVLDAVREFEGAHQNVRVQLQGVPFAQIPDTIRASIQAGEPVDLAQWHAFAAAALGLATPMDDLWAAHLDPDEFLPGAVEDVRWADRFYGVPLDTNAMVLFVNASKLADAGVELPEQASFDDLLQVARATTSEDRSERAIALPASTWTTYGWIRANGGEVVRVGADGGAEFTLDSRPVVEAMSFLGTLAAEQLAYPPFTRHDENDAFALFRSGTTALHASGSWDIPSLEAAGFEWDLEVRTLPRGMRGTTTGSVLGGSSMFIPQGAENRDLAFAFMQQLTSDAMALRLVREEGRLPARTRLFEDPFFDTPAYETIAEQLAVAHPMKLIAYEEATQAFADALEQIITGRGDAAGEMGRAQRAAERSVGERPGSEPPSAGATP